MKDKSSCCRELSHRKMFPSESPFTDLLCTDYYDGPRQGFSRCQYCDSCYYFSRVAEDLDSGVSAYLLYPVSRKSYEEIISALSVFQSPVWPIWVPTWSFPAQGQNHIDGLIKAALPGATENPSFIVASISLHGEVLGCKTPGSHLDADMLLEWVERLSREIKGEGNQGG